MDTMERALVLGLVATSPQFSFVCMFRRTISYDVPAPPDTLARRRCARGSCPIWFGLPYPMARPDEEAALGHALGIAGDLNPQFFHWPSLTFYVFAGILAPPDARESSAGTQR